MNEKETGKGQDSHTIMRIRCIIGDVWIRVTSSRHQSTWFEGLVLKAHFYDNIEYRIEKTET